MNLAELESLFYQIQDIIDYVEDSNFEERSFLLFLSNGDAITYKMFKDNVPHLLGININALLSTGLFKKNSAFEVLKEVISNPYRIHKLYQEGIINYKDVFSDYIYEKIKVFRDNISPNVYETEFVCKYNSRRSFNIKENSEQCDYIILKKIRDTKSYAAQYLINNGRYYKPRSSMFFETKEDMLTKLKDMIQDQEITILNGVHCNGDHGAYKRKYELFPEIKRDKLKQILSYKNTFDCIIDVCKDFSFSLGETVKHMDKRFSDVNLLHDFVNDISEGKIIDDKKYEGSYFKEISLAFNNYLCSKNCSNAKESYSSILEERNNLKKMLEKLELEIKKVTDERNGYLQRNIDLEEKIVDFETREETIRKILGPSSE